MLAYRHVVIHVSYAVILHVFLYGRRFAEIVVSENEGEHEDEHSEDHYREHYIVWSALLVFDFIRFLASRLGFSSFRFLLTLGFS